MQHIYLFTAACSAYGARSCLLGPKRNKLLSLAHINCAHLTAADVVETLLNSRLSLHRINVPTINNDSAFRSDVGCNWTTVLFLILLPSCVTLIGVFDAVELVGLHKEEKDPLRVGGTSQALNLTLPLYIHPSNTMTPKLARAIKVSEICRCLFHLVVYDSSKRRYTSDPHLHKEAAISTHGARRHRV